MRALGRSLVSYGEDMTALNLELKRFLRQNLYRHYRVMRMTGKAGRVVRELFGVFMETPTLMPPEQQDQANSLEQQMGEAGRARAVADYIAGMTDRYAILEHARIFDPAALT